MKHKFLLLAAMMLAATSLFAQSADNDDEVVKIDQWNQNAYREGEILVKFKADGAVQMRAPQRRAFATSQVNAVDALFRELGVDSVEQLMPRTGHINVGRKLRAYNGSEVEVKDLSKLYRLILKPEKAQTIHEAIEQLKALDDVEFAEPNYIVYTMALPYDTVIPTADMQAYTSEPLYSQQWGIPAINLPQLWNMPKKSSKRPVIAILDTGVDIEHPDLAANIWTNAAEAAGIAGQDDDANGFKDDIHGWSFIDNHSVTNDFNGHGTHCAGIAAAVGNNGIGITGANPDALIMPVTVMQSNGTGDVATIVKGIDYAAANGADVISMSIGGYGYSMAEEQALGRAYANAVLVAAAGNDGHAMVAPNHCFFDAPMFPAAFSFVLGVEATQQQPGLCGYRACFSNYDETGPIYSSFGENELYNYELQAPGVQILSTFPGGRYKILNGTSMACPLAAGAISRLIQCKEILSQELLFGDLIHTLQNHIDMLATYNITDVDRHPELALVTANLTDTASGDGDMRADAGETIEFYPIFKNAWGQAENIRYWMKTGYYSQGDWVWDDTTLVQHLQDTAYFGKPLSSYAKATSLNPYRIHISPDCADGRKINMIFFAICDNAADTLRQTITMMVENGVEIGGMITEDLTLYPNVHYIVTNNLAIPEGVKLTIKPGTILRFRAGTGISVKQPQRTSKSGIINGKNVTISYPDTTTGGRIIARGTKDSLIVFSFDPSAGNSSEIIIHTNLSVPSAGGYYYDTLFNFVDYWEFVKIEMGNARGQIFDVFLKDCIIENLDGIGRGHYGFGIQAHQMVRCQYINCNNTRFSDLGNTNHYTHLYSNFANINRNDFLYAKTSAGINLFRDCNIYPIMHNNESRERFVLASTTGTPEILSVPSSIYFGTSNLNILKKYVYDIDKNYYYGKYNLSNIRNTPIREAHGIVWKLLVDGVDAQDEFELLPPIGVGQHKVDVYFNRPMNVSVEPVVSFGVRQPYTQHQVNENGSWSADSTIYTAYFTISGKSLTDGYNTFRIYGAEDPDHFPIAEENFRFNMEVAATGSMSTGLMAEAGLGKVTLNWETDEEDFADLLGYNLYRWKDDTIWNKNKTEFHFDTICINTSLIDASDTAFVDFDVIPGKDYYYVIRQVTTSLNSYDLSNPVVARPLTAIKGDANGSMSVDVADVITEVNYITRQNPQPFIFEAADVNSDNDVNIIDVVSTIDLILHPETQTNAINEDPAYYYIENGILYVESDIVLGGVQCTFTAEQGHTFTTLDALNGFETVGTWQAEDQYLFLAFSMSGRTLGVGKHALLQVGDAELSDIVLSDATGHNINALPQVSTALDGTSVFLPCSGKFIKDGTLYIKIGNRIYSATGTLIE